MKFEKDKKNNNNNPELRFPPGPGLGWLLPRVRGTGQAAAAPRAQSLPVANPAAEVCRSHALCPDVSEPRPPGERVGLGNSRCSYNNFKSSFQGSPTSFFHLLPQTW